MNKKFPVNLVIALILAALVIAAVVYQNQAKAPAPAKTEGTINFPAPTPVPPFKPGCPCDPTKGMMCPVDCAPLMPVSESTP